MASNEDVLGDLWPQVGDWRGQYAKPEGGVFSPRSEPIVFTPDDAFGEDLEDTKRKYKLLPDLVGTLSSTLGGLFHTDLSQSAMPDYSPPTMEPQPLGGGEGIRTIAERREEQGEGWRANLLDRAMEEHGPEAVEGLLDHGQEPEDLRPSQLEELVGDIDMERSPPVTALDVAEEALAAEEARAEKDVAPKGQQPPPANPGVSDLPPPKEGEPKRLYATPSDAIVDFGARPEMSASEWRARVQDSWSKSFEEGGANAEAFIRNILRERSKLSAEEVEEVKRLFPDEGEPSIGWSREKAEQFYYSEVMPGVLDTIKNVKVTEAQPRTRQHDTSDQDMPESGFLPPRSFYRHGQQRLNEPYIDEYGYEITALGRPPVGDPAQVGMIGLEKGHETDFAVISHEYGHAVDDAIDNILAGFTEGVNNRSSVFTPSPDLDDTPGEYGSIGTDIASSNENALKGAFPFMGERGPESDEHPEGLRIHSKIPAELSNFIRDWRRHHGEDPTRWDFERAMRVRAQKATRSKTGPLGFDPGHYTEVMQGDLPAHFERTPRENRYLRSLLEKGKDPWSVDDFPEGPPGWEHEPRYETPSWGLRELYRRGTPSPEEMERYFKKFSYATPLSDRLSREFG